MLNTDFLNTVEKKQLIVEEVKEEEKLENSQIQKDPVQKPVEYDNDDNDCSVCLFNRIEVVLPCGHAFCEPCITDWLKKQPECPLCR